jgi:hypothetical protein
MKSESIESLLVPESLKSQLKVIGAFLAAAIPIVISNYALTFISFMCPLVQFSGPPKCEHIISFAFNSGNFSVEI